MKHTSRAAALLLALSTATLAGSSPADAPDPGPLNPETAVSGGYFVEVVSRIATPDARELNVFRASRS